MTDNELQEAIRIKARRDAVNTASLRIYNYGLGTQTDEHVKLALHYLSQDDLNLIKELLRKGLEEAGAKAQKELDAM